VHSLALCSSIASLDVLKSSFPVDRNICNLRELVRHNNCKWCRWQFCQEGSHWSSSQESVVEPVPCINLLCTRRLCVGLVEIDFILMAIVSPIMSCCLSPIMSCCRISSLSHCLSPIMGCLRVSHLSSPAEGISLRRESPIVSLDLLKSSSSCCP
jgi:hypothetical protein